VVLDYPGEVQSVVDYADGVEGRVKDRLQAQGKVFDTEMAKVRGGECFDHSSTLFSA
jgi:hypothetical protein